jgi:hypothetical protein
MFRSPSNKTRDGETEWTWYYINGAGPVVIQMQLGPQWSLWMSDQHRLHCHGDSAWPNGLYWSAQWRHRWFSTQLHLQRSTSCFWNGPISKSLASLSMAATVPKCVMTPHVQPMECVSPLDWIKFRANWQSLSWSGYSPIRMEPEL